MVVGVVTVMAKGSEYYIPIGFPRKTGKWIPPDERGKVIQFLVLERRSA